MTYTLKPTGTSYGDGTAKFTLRHTDRPDTIICAMRLPEEDMDFWNMLLNAQAEKAWAEGYTSGHSRAMRRMSDEPNVSAGTNPYTVQSETDSTVPKTD